MTGLRFAWPNRLLINDLLAARLDIAGIDPARDPCPALVLGTSVNVASHPPQPEPEEYNSIHASGARGITVVDVLEAYASHFLAWSSRWAEEGSLRRSAERGASAPMDSAPTGNSGCSTHRSRAGSTTSTNQGALVLDTDRGTRRITIGEYFGLEPARAE